MGWLCGCARSCFLAARAFLALARAAVTSATANLGFRLRSQIRLFHRPGRTCADKNQGGVREQRGRRRRQHHKYTANSPQAPHIHFSVTSLSTQAERPSSSRPQIRKIRLFILCRF